MHKLYQNALISIDNIGFKHRTSFIAFWNIAYDRPRDIAQFFGFPNLLLRNEFSWDNCSGVLNLSSFSTYFFGDYK